MRYHTYIIRIYNTYVAAAGSGRALACRFRICICYCCWRALERMPARRHASGLVCAIVLLTSTTCSTWLLYVRTSRRRVNLAIPRYFVGPVGAVGGSFFQLSIQVGCRAHRRQKNAASREKVFCLSPTSWDCCAYTLPAVHQA